MTAGRRSVALPGGGAVPAEVTLPAAFHAGTTPLVVLAPGAGSGLTHPFLATIAARLVEAGYAAARFDFPYRAAGRRRPDPRPVLERCWAAVLAAVAADPALAPPWVAIGGKSLGGRIASHLAASAGLHTAVRALVLLGYPLHPAGRPAAARVEHLPAIRVPTLFVQGTRDALAPLDRLRAVLARMPRATLHVVPGADHAFHVPRSSGRDDRAVWEDVAAAVTRFLASLG